MCIKSAKVLFREYLFKHNRFWICKKFTDNSLNFHKLKSTWAADRTRFGLKFFIQLYITPISFLPVDQKSDSTSQGDSKTTEESTEKAVVIKEEIDANGDGATRFVDDTSTIYYKNRTPHQCCLIDTVTKGTSQFKNWK